MNHENIELGESSYMKNMKIYVFLCSPDRVDILELPATSAGLSELSHWYESEWFVGAVFGYRISKNMQCTAVFDAGGLLLGKVTSDNAAVATLRRLNAPQAFRGDGGNANDVEAASSADSSEKAAQKKESLDVDPSSQPN